MRTIDQIVEDVYRGGVEGNNFVVETAKEELKKYNEALQTLIDKVRELENALDRAHKVFGAESDKLKKEFADFHKEG